MIRTGIVLLLLAILIGTLLYFRIPPASTLRLRQFAGIQNCRGCHATPAIGDQYGIWNASAHAHAFAALHGDSAMTWSRNHQNVKPDSDTDCLCCHATAYATSSATRGPEYKIEDGVTCEACHGMSGDYNTYAAMRDHKVFLKLGGVVASQKDCLDCHGAAKNNHACPFTHKPFVAAAAMIAIAHPIPRKSAL